MKSVISVSALGSFHVFVGVGPILPDARVEKEFADKIMRKIKLLPHKEKIEYLEMGKV